MIHDFAITAAVRRARRRPARVRPRRHARRRPAAARGSPSSAPASRSSAVTGPRRSGGCTTDAFWAWHYANAFDDGDVVQLDFPWSSAPGLGRRRPTRAASSRLGSPGPRSTRPRGRSTCHHLDDQRARVPAHRRPPHRPPAPLRHHRRPLRRPGRRSGRARPAVPLRHGRRDERPRRRPRRHRRGRSSPRVTAAPTSSTATTSPSPATSTPTARRCSCSTPPGSPTRPSPPSTCPQRVPNGLHGNWFPAG